MRSVTVDTCVSEADTSPKATPKQPVVQEDSHEIKVAKAWFTAIARADMEKLQKVTHPGCRLLFPGVEISPKDMMEETIKSVKSFPDSNFEFKEAYHKEPNVVYMRVQWSGTHTGPAYGFGPYEEVPTTGKKVAADDELVHVTIQDGLVVKLEVEPTGPITGYHGIYEAIGGLII